MLGVMAFQLLLGRDAFAADPAELPDDEAKSTSREGLRQRIEKEEPSFLPQDDITPEGFDFLNRLLEKDPRMRLGAMGAPEVKQHPFFEVSCCVCVCVEGRVEVGVNVRVCVCVCV
eukprot:TRINITY_DN7744_c0_g1_i4.p2 TRINITY_DN7744_c0_g1~~TRINITY_DN7744_c0_g1_i4.p2  ORF type:complete len:116 (+),score=34.05 TRINITY_DN7744_c0_g1_i4:65-412(+)